MGLVEQAAKKLEQLRQAGQQVPGDLALTKVDDKSRPAPETPDTIEQMALQIKTRRSSPVQEGKPFATEPTTNGLALANPDAVEVAREGARREPVFKLPATANLAPRGPSHPAAGGSRSQVVAIDFVRLAARGVLTPDVPQSPLANTLRLIKRPLLNNCLGKSAGRVQNATRILITSALPGEGKSYVSLNLAMSIAMERDSTVLLVEADPTRPSLSSLMGIPVGRGLMDLLAERGQDVADVLVKTNVPRLSFIPAGTRHQHATELLASTAMEVLVDHLAARYADRVLIFDSGPLLATPEASALARHMGQIVLVIEAEKTTHATVQQALARVESSPVVMTLLNKAVRSYDKPDYYYEG